MKQVIIYQHGDGVAVIYPAEEKTVEDCMRSVPAGVLCKVVDESEIPQDRYFRNAWQLSDKGIGVDIERAKEIQRDRWRKIREPILAALDIEFMMAVEDSSPSRRNTIASKKQALRDVTKTELPDDLDVIRNTIPEVLKP